MNPLEINKEYWQKRNPEIEFRRVKKAYYGTHLLKANIKLNGAALRYYSWARSPNNSDYCPNPNYEEFVLFLKQHTGRFNTQKLLKTEENRWLHVRQSIHLSFEKGFYKEEARLHEKFGTEVIIASVKAMTLIRQEMILNCEATVEFELNNVL